MTQEDKKLLLRDLCARLPYDLVIGISSETYMPVNIWKIDQFDCYKNTVSITCMPCCEDKMVSIEDCKPYLFPLSSMTDTQREEYESLCIKEISECIDISGFYYTKDNYYDTVESIDYLYKNHIDIRGLIPKGLAIDCTELNIY